MKSTLGMGAIAVALSLSCNISQAANPALNAFLFDVNGSASASFSTGSSGSGSFGPTTGVSGNSAVGSAAYSTLGASSRVEAAGLVDSSIGGGFDGTPTEQDFSAAASGIWTGRFVNVLPTARSFSLDVFSINDLSGPGFGGNYATYAAHLYVGTKDYDLSSFYGTNDTFSIGVLAPGQGVDLKLTAYGSADIHFGPNSGSAGALISVISLSGYNAAPIAPVPEPQTYAMFAVGLAGLGLRRMVARHRAPLVPA